MRIRFFAAATLSALLLGPPMAMAATIGVVAPQSGPYALLGNQVLAGARAAAKASGDMLVEIDESCEPGGGTAIARALKDAGAVAAIGFLCVESLTESLPTLKDADIVAIAIASRSGILMEDALRNGWPLFRLAPTDGDEAEKLAGIILEKWKAEPIALVEDGTIYGRELVSAVRQSIEAGGITPVFVDTYRPGQEQQVALVRRLPKAGVTHVLVGGDRNDVAIIARDAAAENIPLQILGGDAMRAADQPVPLRDGVLVAAVPDYAALPEAAEAAAVLRTDGIEPEGYVLPAHAAIELVGRAVAEMGGRSLADVILSTGFETVIGHIAFDTRHELAENPLRLQVWRGDGFVPVTPQTE